MTKKNKVVVGFDLGNDYAQISYCRQDQSMPDTVSLVMGEEQYNIPTLLCRKKGATGSAAWLIGKEALKAAKDGEGTLVDNLLVLAKNNTSVKVGTDSAAEEALTAEYLLELFVRKALALLAAYIVSEEIAAVAYTLKEMDKGIMEMLRNATNRAGQRKLEIYFLSHEDCFFQYMLHQPQEMWIHDVLLYDYRSDGIDSHLLSMNRKTNPVACFIETAHYPQMQIPDLSDKNETAKSAFYKQLDTALLEIVRKNCDQRVITSVFLLGEHFSKEWCRDSLKYMCRGRRVFQGNNLFSKGACYGLLEKLEPSEEGKKHVFLGRDMLKANIGMNVMRQGKESYYALLDAGENWYELYKECDFLLTKEKELRFVITPLDGKHVQTKVIALSEENENGAPYTRYHMEMKMNAPDQVCVKITDLGFGEFYEASGNVWEEAFQIS